MLRRSIVKLARAVLPAFLRKRIDPFHAFIEDQLEEFAAKLQPGARVLDAGAGECPYRSFFARNIYVAVDNTVGESEWDYSRLSAVAEATALPFPSGSFDAAIGIVILEHLSDPLMALREIRRVLRDSGQLLLAAPQFWELHQDPHDFFRYTRYGLEQLLRTAGYRVVRIEPTGGYFHLVGKLSIDFLQFFQSGPRLIFFAVLAPVFGILIPLGCYYLDRFDRKKDFAVGFVAVAEKTGAG